MKKIFLIFCVMFTSIFWSQKTNYKTKSATINFSAEKSNIEPIRAENKEVNLILNPTNGDIACLMNMIDFSFPNKLMEEHFNENYIETEKHPKGTFIGKIKDFNQYDFSSEQKVTIKGDFTIHGVTQTKTFTATIFNSNNIYTINSNLKLDLDDFKIKIPSVMFYKIAEQINIDLVAELKKIK